jgi:hypothetical protein
MGGNKRVVRQVVGVCFFGIGGLRQTGVVRGKDLYLWVFLLIPIGKILALNGGFVWHT